MATQTNSVDLKKAKFSHEDNVVNVYAFLYVENKQYKVKVWLFDANLSIENAYREFVKQRVASEMKLYSEAERKHARAKIESQVAKSVYGALYMFFDRGTNTYYFIDDAANITLKRSPELKDMFVNEVLRQIKDGYDIQEPLTQNTHPHIPYRDYVIETLSDIEFLKSTAKELGVYDQIESGETINWNTKLLIMDFSNEDLVSGISNAMVPYLSEDESFNFVDTGIGKNPAGFRISGSCFYSKKPVTLKDENGNIAYSISEPFLILNNAGRNFVRMMGDLLDSILIILSSKEGSYKDMLKRQAKVLGKVGNDVSDIFYNKFSGLSSTGSNIENTKILYQLITFGLVKENVVVDMAMQLGLMSNDELKEVESQNLTGSKLAKYLQSIDVNWSSLTDFVLGLPSELNGLRNEDLVPFMNMLSVYMAAFPKSSDEIQSKKIYYLVRLPNDGVVKNKKLFNYLFTMEKEMVNGENANFFLVTSNYCFPPNVLEIFGFENVTANSKNGEIVVGTGVIDMFVFDSKNKMVSRYPRHFGMVKNDEESEYLKIQQFESEKIIEDVGSIVRDNGDSIEDVDNRLFESVSVRALSSYPLVKEEVEGHFNKNGLKFRDINVVLVNWHDRPNVLGGFMCNQSSDPGTIQLLSSNHEEFAMPIIVINLANRYLSHTENMLEVLIHEGVHYVDWTLVYDKTVPEKLRQPESHFKAPDPEMGRSQNVDTRVRYWQEYLGESETEIRAHASEVYSHLKSRYSVEHLIKNYHGIKRNVMDILFYEASRSAARDRGEEVPEQIPEIEFVTRKLYSDIFDVAAQKYIDESKDDQAQTEPSELYSVENEVITASRPKTLYNTPIGWFPG
jgi:hypothetical protein